MTVFNRNAKKLDGKRLNAAVDKAYMMDCDPPLDEERTMANEDHTAMVTVGAEGSPSLAVEGSGIVETSRLKGAFSDSDQLRAEIREDYLWIYKGEKDAYWFPIYEHHSEAPKAPRLYEKGEDFAVFDISPKELAKLAKNADYVLFETGHSKKSRKSTVFVSFYDKDDNFLKGIDLVTPWTGKESAAFYPAEEIGKWGRLGDKGTARMGTNRPMKIVGDDSGVKYSYFLAPRIEEGREQVSPVYRELSGAEREWVASRNLKQKRLPGNTAVVEADRRRIEETFGSRRRFVERVDEMLADGAPSPYDAVYAWYSNAQSTTPRWMVAAYLSQTIGPDYRAFGDEYDVYARLLARDGASMYDEIGHGTKKKTVKSGNRKNVKGNGRKSAKKGSQKTHRRN